MADGTDQPLGITTEPAGPPISGERPEAYRPVSLLAILSFLAALGFAAVIVADGTVAFASRTFWVMAALTVLTPFLAALGAAMAGVRGAGRLWSIAGLSLVVLYAGPITLGGLVAFPGRVPWLLPGWILIVPLAAGALCWIARNRIQSSEGTLGGLALTTWGLWLSFYFGLIYAVYFAGTRLAVEQQATDFVEEYLNRLKRGEVEKAFLLTLEPSRRPSEEAATLRNELEMRFNVPGPNGEGALARFGRLEHVRLLELEGAESTFEKQSFSWAREATGYEAQFRYRINTPTASLTLFVHAVGEESPEGGRVWHIGRGTDTAGPLEYTPEGRRLTETAMAAGRYLQGWQQRVREQNWNEAYLATLPPDRREQERAALAALPQKDLVVTGLGPLVVVPPEGREALERRAQFFAGSVFAGLDRPSFWTPPGRQNEVREALGRFFMPVGAGFPEVSLRPESMPTWGREGKYFRVGFDVGFATPGPPGGGIGSGLQYHGRAILLAEAPPDGHPQDGWWLDRIELIRAQVPATPEMVQGPPG